MKKAIFLDIDGTILDCLGGITKITPKVEQAIRDLQSRGHYVFIATGRPYAFVSKEILEFGFDGFILANGAHVLINNETIYSKAMEKSFIKALEDKLETNNIQYILETTSDCYIKERCIELYEFYNSVGISSKYLKFEYNIEEVDILKVEMICLDKKLRDDCLEFVNNYSGYDYFNSISQEHVEIYFKESTKAMGISKAIEHLGISMKNTYAFGDGKNDIEMLAAVGCGIAMGNASDEVKKYAKKVTDTVQNDGVAVGIEKYVI